MSIEAMRQALEALEEINKLSIGENAICLPAEIDTAMDALRQAIEQAEQPWVKSLLALRQAEKQEPQHDYRTRYDRGCYKCGSHYCPADCPEPPHLVRQQPQPEPMAWRWKERINGDFDSWVISVSEPPPYAIEKQPLYTAPPQRKPWVELERDDMPEGEDAMFDHPYFIEGMAYAAKKLKEKNT